MVRVKAVKNVDTPVGQVEAFALTSDNYLLATPTAFLFQKIKQTGSPNSVKNYAYDLKRFYSYLLIKYKSKYEGKSKDDYRNIATQNDLYKEFDNDSASKFFEGLKNGLYGDKPLAPKSLQRIESTVIGFYKFCFEAGLTDDQLVRKIFYKDRDPVLTVTKGITSNLSEQYYSEKEFQKVILANVYGKNSFVKARNRLALKLSYGLGLRPHELLRADNFNKVKLQEVITEKYAFESVSLDIVGKGNKLRSVTASPDLVDALREFIYKLIPKQEQQTGLKHLGCIFTTAKLRPLVSERFFGDAFRDAYRYYIQKQKVSKLEAEAWLKRDPYSMRHCFATNAVISAMKNNAPYQLIVKEMMGHESFETTLNYIYFAALLTSSLSVESKDEALLDISKQVLRECEVDLEKLKSHKRGVSVG
jgi:integrase